MSVLACVAPRTNCPPAGETLIIQPMGDSITAGTTPNGNWRSILMAKIAGKLGGSIGPSGVVDSTGGLNSALYGYDPDTTGTAFSGYPGMSAAQAFGLGMDALSPAALDVDMLLMMWGANDGGDDPNTVEFYISPLIEQWFANHPAGTAFIASRTPRNGSSGTLFAAAVKDTVDYHRSLGMNVVYVDMYRAVTLIQSVDGLHYPGAAPCQQMADAWFNIMDPYIRRP